MTESKHESLAERLESYANLLICGEMVDDLRAVVRLVTDLKTDLFAANFRCVQLGVQLAKAKEDGELLAACNESMEKSTSALWRILAPEYEGDISIQEMASVLMKALANALKDSRRMRTVLENAEHYFDSLDWGGMEDSAAEEYGDQIEAMRAALREEQP